MSPSATNRQIDELTRSLGHEMFDRMRGSKPWILESEWWEERLMQQCMQNEWLKVQAFRFVDALPTILDNSDEVARHLREYFVPRRRGLNGHGHHADPAADRRAALAELESNGNARLLQMVSKLMDFDQLDSSRARLFVWLSRVGARSAARRFIAGSNVREAVQAIQRLRNQQLAFTIDVLGEAAISRSECAVYEQTYLDLITQLPEAARGWAPVPLVDAADGEPIPRVNVSVKLTSIHSGIDAIAPEATKTIAKDRLRPLLRAGMQRGAHIHIDMEHFAIKDITLDICREILTEKEFRDYPHFGIVLQAYLVDADKDVADTIAWVRQRGVPIWVRLVKGAYWDTETVIARQRHWSCPVWMQKWQSDACYERCSRELLRNHKHIYSAFASHNIRSLAHAMALRRLWSIPSKAFELQMLYGMGDPIKRAAVEMGERSRIYTPYGDLIPGMAYLIRRLLENTANESFLAHTASDDTPEDELLRDPQEIGSETPPHEEPFVVRFEFEEPVMDPFENVPNTDFTLERSRQQMLTGLAHVRAALGREIPLVIGGQRQKTSRTFESRNPSRPAETVGRIAVADAGSIDRAVSAAAGAFATWRRLPPAERSEFLFRLAEIMEAKRFELAALAAIECGKPWREADADVSEAIDYCNYYGKEMIRITEHARRRDIPGETNEYAYAPLGVVAVISPWNFPLALLTGMTSAGIVAGNTVVMKPSSQAACVAFRLVEMFEEAGLPDGVLNFLPGPGGEVGEALVRHRGTAMVAFTGSREVGERIYRLAAENPSGRPALKKVVVEMGGKNAIIVDSDAEIGSAVTGVVGSAFSYSGQKCTACSRVIVLEGVYDRFVERLVESARGLGIGAADEPTTAIPPLIDAAALQRVQKYVATGKQEAKCALESPVPEIATRSGGFFVGPTIFVDVPPTARIAREEIFGPVLCVLKARDIGQAIEIFNGTDYALTGGIYSRSPANIERFRHEAECGNLYINRIITGSMVDLQPFGGVRMSGLGTKVGGPDYLIQYCEPRTVTENTLRRGFAPSEEVAKVVG